MEEKYIMDKSIPLVAEEHKMQKDKSLGMV